MHTWRHQAGTKPKSRAVENLSKAATSEAVATPKSRYIYPSVFFIEFVRNAAFVLCVFVLLEALWEVCVYLCLVMCAHFVSTCRDRRRFLGALQAPKTNYDLGGHATRVLGDFQRPRNLQSWALQAFPQSVYGGPAGPGQTRKNKASQMDWGLGWGQGDVLKMLAWWLFGAHTILFRKTQGPKQERFGALQHGHLGP